MGYTHVHAKKSHLTLVLFEQADIMRHCVDSIYVSTMCRVETVHTFYHFRDTCINMPWSSGKRRGFETGRPGFDPRSRQDGHDGVPLGRHIS